MPNDQVIGARPQMSEQQRIAIGIEQAALAVMSDRPLDDVLVTILESCAICYPCLYPSIALLDEQEGRLVGHLISTMDTWRSIQLATASGGARLDHFLGFRESLGSISGPAVVRYSLTNAENLVVRVFVDRQADICGRYYDLVRPQLLSEDAASAQQALGVGSIAVVPLLAAGRCLGVLAAGASPAHPFSDVGMQILRLLAGQAATAVRFAGLQQDLRDREQQVSLLLKATIDAQEEERERICLDIHDGVAQALAPAFQYLQTLDNRPELLPDLRTTIRKAAGLVRTAIHEARDVIATLRPAALDTLGLVPTLRYELDELCTQMGWRIEFDADETRFPKAVETALYRIIHEAVSNVTKHARAKRVVLRLKQEQDGILVEVRDDGLGFDSVSLERRVLRRGVGLLSMRKRVELLQGIFELITSPGNGTLVRVRVPLLVDTNEVTNPNGDEDESALSVDHCRH